MPAFWYFSTRAGVSPLPSLLSSLLAPSALPLFPVLKSGASRDEGARATEEGHLRAPLAQILVVVARERARVDGDRGEVETD